MSRWTIALCCLFLYLIPNTVFGTELLVAVLEFSGPTGETAFLHTLSDQSRIIAANTLPSAQYQVITRESLHAILQDMGKDMSCLSGACEVEIA